MILDEHDYNTLLSAVREERYRLIHALKLSMEEPFDYQMMFDRYDKLIHKLEVLIDEAEE